MTEKVIEFRKQYNKIVFEAKKDAQRGECIWCRKKITSFCNSHSVPRFVINNISVDGKVEYFNDFIQIPFLDEMKGVNVAGTFKLLCRECDSIIFQDYENPEKISAYPSEKILEEIALKNMLFMLNKRYFEVEQLSIIEKSGMPYPYEQRTEVQNLDLRDFEWDYARIKTMMLAGKSSGFKVIVWEKIPYKVPIAFQGMMTIYGDFEGDLAADIYDKNYDVFIPHIHVAVFPLESESIVTVFYHEDDHEYDAFATQLQTFDAEEKLSAINFLIWKFTEDVLISPLIPHRKYFINNIRDTALETDEIWAGMPMDEEIAKNQQKMALKYRDKNIPNVLSEKYKLK